MDIVVYLTTAAITIVWSVWIYLWWESRAGLSEEAALRVLLIVAPSTYFLLIAVSGWSQVQSFRLDLAGLVVLDGVTVVIGILLVTILAVASVNRRPAYVTLLAVYNAAALVEIAFLYAVRSNPALLVRVSRLVGELGRMNLLSFSWVGTSEPAGQPDLVGLLNKILIALLSYIPVSIIRFAAGVRRRRKIERELARLRGKVERLERELIGKGSGVVK